MLIPLTYLFRKYNLKINGVVHVGAHYGEELSDYAKFSISNVYFFEPLIENFQKLQEEISKFNKKIKIYSHCCALGNIEGEHKIYLSSNQLESSSLLEPDEHLIDHPEVKFFGERNIKLKKLDKFNIENCNFLNMDVQGYELEVLKGGKNTLKKIDYIYCEINRSSTYKDNALVNDIDIFLEKYGFNRYETTWAGENISWGDAFYIRKEKALKKWTYILFFFTVNPITIKRVTKNLIKRFTKKINIFRL